MRSRRPYFCCWIAGRPAAGLLSATEASPTTCDGAHARLDGRDRNKAEAQRLRQGATPRCRAVTQRSHPVVKGSVTRRISAQDAARRAAKTTDAASDRIAISRSLSRPSAPWRLLLRSRRRQSGGAASRGRPKSRRPQARGAQAPRPSNSAALLRRPRPRATASIRPFRRGTSSLWGALPRPAVRWEKPGAPGALRGRRMSKRYRGQRARRRSRRGLLTARRRELASPAFRPQRPRLEPAREVANVRSCSQRADAGAGGLRRPAMACWLRAAETARGRFLLR